MTGDQIIDLARANFGEATALTVTTATALDYLNQACAELYNDLPAERMRERLQATVLATPSGKGAIPTTWDRIVEVLINDIPATQVPKDALNSYDYGTLGLFVSPIPIFHIDDGFVWIRPTSGTLTVERLVPPATISNSSAEVTEFSEDWHYALSLLITSYMYAQEEDLTQAQHYKSQYISTLLMEGVVVEGEG